MIGRLFSSPGPLKFEFRGVHTSMELLLFNEVTIAEYFRKDRDWDVYVGAYELEKAMPYIEDMVLPDKDMLMQKLVEHI